MQNNISEVKIMLSPAGYYIGREWYETDPIFKNEYPTEPYSRNSGYFRTKEEAKAVLDENNYFIKNDDVFYFSARTKNNKQ